MTRISGSKHYIRSGSEAYFYTWVEIEVTSQTESGTNFKWRRGVYSYGNWATTFLQFDDWCEGKYLTSTNGSGAEVATTTWTSGYLAYGSSRSFSWSAGYYTSSSTHSASLSYTYKPATPTWKPNAATGLSHKRSGDSKNVLFWTNNPTTTRPYASVKVERSTDGGSWSEIASVSGSATGYSDASVSANHSYSYRVRPYNSAGYGDYTAATARTYNTPAAPTSVSAAVKSGTVVTVSVDNPALTATSLELQKSADGESWEAVATASGSPVESLDADLGGGEFWLRARNARGSLASAWTVSSGKTVTECPPAAPTLVSPGFSEVVDRSVAEVAFAWRHNPIDGSAQTAAQVRYSTDGGASWEVLDVDGAAQSASVANAFDANSTVTWGARTKGADDDCGPWSGSRSFHVRNAPQAAFEQPSDGFVVADMPIHVELSYVDEGWKLAEASVSVVDGSGAVLYSEDMGASLECDIDAAEFLPENGASYTLVASVRSTSTLQGTASRAFSVDFVEPQPAELFIDPDVDTGAVLLVLTLGELSEDMAEAAHSSVYRVHDGGRMLLAEGVQPGDAVVDRYAPVGVDYSYEAVSFAESGAYSTSSFPAKIESGSIYYVFDGGTARLQWGAVDSWDYGHPGAEEVSYWGAEYPTRYDTGEVELKGKDSGHVMSTGDWRAFGRLADAGGLCVRKSPRGDVFRVGAESSMEDNRTGTPYMGKASVKWTRVAGDPL